MQDLDVRPRGPGDHLAVQRQVVDLAPLDLRRASDQREALLGVHLDLDLADDRVELRVGVAASCSRRRPCR
jgi:hypothetical protein